MREFEPPAGYQGLRLLSYGKTMYGLGSAVDVVDLIERERFVILGMEGFNTDGRALVALVEFIADFSGINGSWPERTRTSAHEARRVLQIWNVGLEPEFVLISTASE